MVSSFSKVRVAEIPLLPRLALELWLAEIGLATFGFKRMLALMPVAQGRQPDDSASPESAAQTARRLAWLVQGVARRLPGSPRCLAQSLVLRSLLARHGLSGQLIIGVRMEAAAFDAHAWIEHCGEPLQPAAPVHRPIAAL